MPSNTLPTAGRQWIEKALSLVPVFLALATLFVAVMQQINGLGPAITVQTLVVGWLLVTPVAALLLWPTPDWVPGLSLGLGDGERAATTAGDPVEQLRERYASGDLSDEAFERKLDRLLETEDVAAEGAADRHRDVELE